MKITDFIIVPSYPGYPENALHGLEYLGNLIFEGNYPECCKVYNAISKIIFIQENGKNINNSDIDWFINQA
jgi:hypothetical protein